MSEKFPARSDLSISDLDDKGRYPVEHSHKPKLTYASVRVAPELKGFGYCDRVTNIDGLPYSGIGKLRYKNEVNGEAIVGELDVNPGPFFERDEYLYLPASYSIVNVWGGL